MTARLLVAVLLALATLWVLPAPAYACTCATATDATYLQQADVVFSGTVTSEGVDPRSGGRTITFDVDRVFKGVATATQVITPPSDSCSTAVERPGRYVVFAVQQGVVLSERGCGGSRPGPAPASLGLGQPPQPDPTRADPGPGAGKLIPVIGLALAAGAAGVVGWSLIRRRPT